MGLREIPFKVSYDSDVDDILNDFYIPALSKSTKYRRIAGFFSSTALAVAARGISRFIMNSGSMRLLVGARLSQSDVDAIATGHELRKSVEKTFVRELDFFENELTQDHVKALAWLVQQGRLDIKVAVPIDSKGLPLDENSVQQRGIFHQKIGILEDNTGDVISFSGSVNETAMGWLHNIEEFKVFRSWVDGEHLHLKSDFAKFDRYWYSQSSNVIIMDVPSAVKSKLIEMAPSDFDQLRIKIERRKETQRITLRDYQQDCVSRWLMSGKGVIEMATGTGKTFVAIACLNELRKKTDQLAVVITCPFIHLVSQWERNLAFWELNATGAFGNSSQWKDRLMNEIYDLNSKYRNLLIVVTTHDTFGSDQFIEMVSKIKTPVLLIADEVHGLGSPERRKALLPKYDYRIGLSATPKRWFDEEGTDLLFDFFGETIFEFSLKAAIPEFLCPYEYHLQLVELAPDEMDEYRNLTKKIARQYFTNKSSDEKARGTELLLIQRQRIIINARNKIGEFIKLLELYNNNLMHCLVYCSPNQILETQGILNARGIVQHKFTAEETMKERNQILDSFASGTYQALVAMKCLDEGVDVPATETAIILASTTNPREFIQRRGRILRKHPGKEKAVIHDMMVVPSFSPNFDPEIMEIERRILKKELRRVSEFAESSLNPIETLNKIFNVVKRYGIALEELKDEQRTAA